MDRSSSKELIQKMIQEEANFYHDIRYLYNSRQWNELSYEIKKYNSNSHGDIIHSANILRGSIIEYAISDNRNSDTISIEMSKVSDFNEQIITYSMRPFVNESFSNVYIGFEAEYKSNIQFYPKIDLKIGFVDGSETSQKIDWSQYGQIINGDSVKNSFSSKISLDAPSGGALKTKEISWIGLSIDISNIVSDKAKINITNPVMSFSENYGLGEIYITPIDPKNGECQESMDCNTKPILYTYTDKGCQRYRCGDVITNKDLGICSESYIRDNISLNTDNFFGNDIVNFDNPTIRSTAEINKAISVFENTKHNRFYKQDKGTMKNSSTNIASTCKTIFN